MVGIGLLPELPINTISFRLVDVGRKTLESRLATDPILTKLKVGDQFRMLNRETGETIDCQIKAMRRFPSSEAAAGNENLSKMGDYATPLEFITRMRLFQSEDDETAAGGVIVAEFMLI